MEPLSVTRTTVLDAGPEAAWRAISDPVELAGWLGGSVDLELVPGGAGRFADDDGTARRMVVAHVAPGRSIGWVWWDEDAPADCSAVEVRVEGDGAGGARVTVTETAVTGGATACVLAAADLGDRWDERLDRVLDRVAVRLGARTGVAPVAAAAA